jgi:hypothetical protein
MLDFPDSAMKAFSGSGLSNASHMLDFPERTMTAFSGSGLSKIEELLTSSGSGLSKIKELLTSSPAPLHIQVENAWGLAMSDNIVLPNKDDPFTCYRKGKSHRIAMVYIVYMWPS